MSTRPIHCPDLDLVLSGAVDGVTAGAVPYRFLPKVVASLARPPRGAGRVGNDRQRRL